MPRDRKQPRQLSTFRRAVIEISSILFLFYANLLMGEFTRHAAPGKTLTSALHNIITPTNFAIALISSVIGYALFETLRKSL